MEEIDKNDSIQKLIFSEPSSIKFVATNDVPDNVSVSNKAYRITPVIDGKKIDSKFVELFAIPKVIGNEEYFQILINVSSEIRRLGIAEKLLTSFIMNGYSVCYLFDGTDIAMSNLWKKVSKDGRIKVSGLYNKGGELIGVKARCRE